MSSKCSHLSMLGIARQLLLHCSTTSHPCEYSLHTNLRQNPDSNYLIETRPEFTDINNLLGSDYLLEALGYDADKTIKRLGDAFFENQLIRDALIKETNSQYIGDGSGGNISLSAKSISNQSSMYAGNNLSLAADLLKNTSSLGAGGNLLLATRGDLQDGRLFAQGDVRLLAAGAINNNGSVSSNNVVAVAHNMLGNSKAGSINAQQNVLLQSTQNNVVNNGSLSGSNVTFDAGS